jgi:hypothetical protein
MGIWSPVSPTVHYQAPQQVLVRSLLPTSDYHREYYNHDEYHSYLQKKIDNAAVCVIQAARLYNITYN